MKNKIGMVLLQSEFKGSDGGDLHIGMCNLWNGQWPHMVTFLSFSSGHCLLRLWFRICRNLKEPHELSRLINAKFIVTQLYVLFVFVWQLPHMMLFNE